MKTMHSLDEVTKMINAGQVLAVAGDEALLKKLPKGRWVGGTIPYFMSDKGGIITHDELQVTMFPETIKEVNVKSYSVSELKNIPKNYKPNGFSMCIVPALTEVHQAYAKECSTWDGFFDQPIVGWISGINLKDLGSVTPKVIDGSTGQIYDKNLVVMHMALPNDTFANINILNLFKQGAGDSITFDQAGFEVKDCYINGTKTNLADYLLSKKIDTRLPLVANYMGAMINVSFQAVDEKNKKVSLYAPVFPNVAYKIAEPVENYQKQFEAELSKANVKPLFSCNCILNFLYAELEGKKTGHITGPITFGEIAYILLNQTMVYVTFDKK